MALRWTEYTLQSYSNILLGFTLIFFGLAAALNNSYSHWPGWLAAGAGVAWIIHGLMVPYIGLFDSPPRGVELGTHDRLGVGNRCSYVAQRWRGHVVNAASPVGPVTA